MISAIMAESFKDHKKAEYIRFAENLGTGIRFSEDKWICDKLRRAPAEKTNIFTLYFHQIPVQYSDMVKYFSLICFIQGKAVSSIKNNITNLIRFFDFWFAKYKSMGLNMCDEFVAANFYSYLEEYGLAESTNSTIWSSVNSFFKTMREWDDTPLKNPFSVTPYHRQKKFGEKYIPESVALQLDRVFKNEDASLHLRCAYWLLRLIPSRISEIVGMRIDCLKRYNGNYVLFIPTWKQNGGWQEPIMRSIHLEDTGMAGYLIDLVKKQQDSARQLQQHLSEDKKDALFCYQQVCQSQKRSSYVTKLYKVFTKKSVVYGLRNICIKYNIIGDDGQIYKITTHQFRHNGITDRLAAGFTTAQIAEMTSHHGSAMILNSYNHLDLLPEKIIEKQEYVSQETSNRDNRYILFGGRILNMEEQLEKRLLRNLRAHKVRGGICCDITGCKSDMWNCLDCGFFVPDADQIDYYETQIDSWCEKAVKFAEFPLIKENSEKNAQLYESVLKKLKGGKLVL